MKNKTDRWDIANEIDNTYRELMQPNLFKWAKQNEEAGQRARVASCKLQKLLVSFRKESMRIYKERYARTKS